MQATYALKRGVRQSPTTVLGRSLFSHAEFGVGAGEREDYQTTNDSRYYANSDKHMRTFVYS